MKPQWLASCLDFVNIELFKLREYMGLKKKISYPDPGFKQNPTINVII